MPDSQGEYNVSFTRSSSFEAIFIMSGDNGESKKTLLECCIVVKSAVIRYYSCPFHTSTSSALSVLLARFPGRLQFDNQTRNSVLCFHHYPY